MATHCHVERYVCPANNPEEVADAVELAMNTIKGHQHISTHKSGDVCEGAQIAALNDVTRSGMKRAPCSGCDNKAGNTESMIVAS